MSQTTVPVVNTPLGKIKGRACGAAKKINAKQVYRYSGIPFAKPPVGDLRFEPPQKFTEPWDGILDGTQLKAIPMQQTDIMKSLEAYFLVSNEFDEDLYDADEDCLYVKVYTPNPYPDSKLPVMVWFYGGGIQMGGSASYDGSVLSGCNDVVVVMPNYRVNVFGFLSFKPGETTCNGNMGLMDQRCALEWVKENISAFGGDPDNVTIFGQSAGSGSVSLHMMSQQSRHLYHKAICHSGVADDNMILDKHNSAATEKLLEVLKIDKKDPKEALKKLKKVPAKDILQANSDMGMEMKYFSIAIDGDFITEMPTKTLKGNNLHRVPYMVGINSTEGYGLLAQGLDKGYATGLNAEDAEAALKGYINFIYQPSQDKRVWEKIWNKYLSIFSDENDPMRYSRIVGECTGDCNFVNSSMMAANSHSGNGVPTYFYRMTQKLQYSHEKEFQPDEGAVFKSDICECDHGDDCIFTFGQPLSKVKLNLNVKFSEEEQHFSEQWMGYMTNFAATGNPNKGKFKPEIQWEDFGKNKKHLEASSTPQLKDDFYHDRYKFWTQQVKETS